MGYGGYQQVQLSCERRSQLGPGPHKTSRGRDAVPCGFFYRRTAAHPKPMLSTKGLISNDSVDSVSSAWQCPHCTPNWAGQSTTRTG